MLEVVSIKAGNFEDAIFGMRQPFKTTNKNDSLFGLTTHDEFFDNPFNNFINNIGIELGAEEIDEFDEIENFYLDRAIIRQSNGYPNAIEYALIGPNDLDLATRLIKAGTPHDKFLRQIPISLVIRAPLYFWKELDTYKVATVADSESTMHTITKTGFSKDNFSHDDSFYDDKTILIQGTRNLTYEGGMTLLDQDIFILNALRQKYLNEKDPVRKKKIWRTMIQKLPDSYMQQRVWTGNYRTARSIVQQRNPHKLDEWTYPIMEALKTLPYAEEFIFI